MERQPDYVDDIRRYLIMAPSNDLIFQAEQTRSAQAEGVISSGEGSVRVGSVSIKATYSKEVEVCRKVDARASSSSTLSPLYFPRRKVRL